MYLQASVWVLSNGSNPIMWQREVGVTEMHCGYVWCGLGSRKSACSIPVHYQSKPEIVPSRTCARVFSCPLTTKQFLYHLSPLPKFPFTCNSFPTLKRRTRPRKGCRAFSSVTWKHGISIPWKRCTSFFCWCWSRRITTLAYQQKPVLCTVYKTACDLVSLYRQR